jgi:hypothetical protein
MAQRIAGTLFFKIDGTQYPAKGKFTYSTLTTEKTGVVGVDGPHGYKEVPVLPFIKGTITDMGKLSLSQLQNIKKSVITLELANGKTVTLRDSWLEGKAEANADEAEVEVEFRGMSALEQVAA